MLLLTDVETSLKIIWVSRLCHHWHRPTVQRGALRPATHANCSRWASCGASRYMPNCILLEAATLNNDTVQWHELGTEDMVPPVSSALTAPFPSHPPFYMSEVFVFVIYCKSNFSLKHRITLIWLKLPLATVASINWLHGMIFAVVLPKKLYLDRRNWSAGNAVSHVKLSLPLLFYGCIITLWGFCSATRKCTAGSASTFGFSLWLIKEENLPWFTQPAGAVEMMTVHRHKMLQSIVIVMTYGGLC